MNARDEAIMVPHSGIGGCAPIPRKPNAAAVNMMPLMSSVTRTITLDRHSGTMWRRMILPLRAPVSRTAAMKSLPRTVSVSARASRA